MKKLIKVTKKHIKNGVIGHAWNGPVTRALEEAGINGVALGMRDEGYVFDPTGATMDLVIAPRSVQRFASAFDNRKPVKPFNFYFDMDILK